ncbi:multidrug ABC transporter permease [uncultured Rothia sp.]|uniref:multidrug ABC transporter permease n=1 Tax=uncultured Rothia sp. TaxID=316088 RepID=UPI0025D29789|nr:multidrug ABC transporter permease [uncultured Rothia sp.]
MSERTPKQPLNDPEYTVPEYSVLLPSSEAENSTAGGDAASNNVASDSAADSSAAEDNAPGDSAPEHASTPEQTITGYTAPVASEQVIPKRPQAMRSVMWCATAMIALRVLSSSLSILLPDQSYTDFERAMVTLFSTLAFTLLASIIPIFVLWKIWEGREWARVITIIYSALMAANDVITFATHFTDPRYFSRLMGGSQSSASYVAGTVSNIMMIALYILMIVLLTRAPIRTYTQIVSGARTLERQQMMSETRQAAGQVPAELREIFADDEDDERTSSGGNTPRPPHRSAGWGT